MSSLQFEVVAYKAIQVKRLQKQLAPKSKQQHIRYRKNKKIENLVCLLSLVTV